MGVFVESFLDLDQFSRNTFLHIAPEPFLPASCQSAPAVFSCASTSVNPAEPAENANTEGSIDDAGHRQEALHRAVDGFSPPQASQQGIGDAGPSLEARCFSGPSPQQVAMGKFEESVLDLDQFSRKTFLHIAPETFLPASSHSAPAVTSCASTSVNVTPRSLEGDSATNQSTPCNSPRSSHGLGPAEPAENANTEGSIDDVGHRQEALHRAVDGFATSCNSSTEDARPECPHLKGAAARELLLVPVSHLSAASPCFVPEQAGLEDLLASWHPVLSPQAAEGLPIVPTSWNKHYPGVFEQMVDASALGYLTASQQSSRHQPKGTGQAAERLVPVASKEKDTGNQDKEDHPSYTMVMLKNIPSTYTYELLVVTLIEAGFHKLFDFVYLPRCFKKGSLHGYAFVNLVNHETAVQFRTKMRGCARWLADTQGQPLAQDGKGDAAADVRWGEIHGKQELIKRYRNSDLMHPNVAKEFKPLAFGKDGKQEPFPAPDSRKRLRMPRAIWADLPICKKSLRRWA